MKRIVGVIPARFGAKRFPGKPLVKICGKPMLQWVIEGVRSSSSLTEMMVATDHDEIRQLADSCGVKAIMTRSDLASGSDRVWEAVKEIDCDIVVNIQGDEPLIRGSLVDQLVEPFLGGEEVEMTTLGRSLQDGDLDSLSTAKIVLNRRHEALYFSRFPIPHSRVDAKQLPQVCLKHIGLYAYRKDFLRAFCEIGPVSLELAESLEQLRALYLGARIRVVNVEAESWGVDTPEDVTKIELMIQRGHKDAKS